MGKCLKTLYLFIFVSIYYRHNIGLCRYIFFHYFCYRELFAWQLKASMFELKCSVNIQIRIYIYIYYIYIYIYISVPLLDVEGDEVRVFTNIDKAEVDDCCDGVATQAKQSYPAIAIPMLVKKRTSSRSITSYPPLFVVSQNTKFLSSVETWMLKLVKR